MFSMIEENFLKAMNENDWNEYDEYAYFKDLIYSGQTELAQKRLEFFISHKNPGLFKKYYRLFLFKK